jgi:hypothetical protein
LGGIESIEAALDWVGGIETSHVVKGVPMMHSITQIVTVRGGVSGKKKRKRK